MSTKTKDAGALIQLYKALKVRYPEAVVLFRVGAFYETFGDDADILHKVLGLQVTKRAGIDITSRLAGFDAAELDGYLARLIRAGHKVAVCDQLEDPLHRIK